MPDKIMQCCYTNSSQEIGGKVSSGWKAVAISEGIPSDAYNTCVSMQNVNSSIQTNMVDERGNVLNLFELSGDGNYIYLMRTKYGLLDRLGRANMFSHAFLFSCKDNDVLTDPNTFLTVDNRNFKDNEADAADTLKSITRIEPFNIDNALETAEMSEQSCLTLIQCVYTQMSERKASKPLYIQYNGTDVQMRAILYCVYHCLPFFMRKALCSASAAAGVAGSKNIIFSEFANTHDYYFNPKTGENNILTPRAERKVARYGFVDYVARNLRSISEVEYFSKLENTASKLGDSSASNDLILKIAHQYITDKEKADTLDDTEIEERLSDALRSKSQGSALMEEIITLLLIQVTKRRLVLTEESENNLAERLNSPLTKELTYYGTIYNSQRLGSLSTEEAAKKLSGMSQSMFNSFRRTLRLESRGLQILDCYYSDYKFSDQAITWEYLNQVWDEISDLSACPNTDDKISALAWNLYCTELKENAEPVKAYDNYMALVKLIFRGKDTEGCDSEARAEYWKNEDIEKAESYRLDEYSHFLLPDNYKCQMILKYITLPSVYNIKGTDGFLIQINEFYKTYEKLIKSRNVLKKIIEGIQAADDKSDRFLFEWANYVIALKYEKLVKLMLNIKQTVYNADFSSFSYRYEKFIEACLELEGSKLHVFRLNEILIQVLADIDRRIERVPLDVWLLIGKNDHNRNPFYIFESELFEKARPYVFSPDNDSFIKKSELLYQNRYIEDAELFVRERLRESKEVKRWLSIVKQAEKGRQPTEIIDDSEKKSSGLFSKLLHKDPNQKKPK